MKGIYCLIIELSRNCKIQAGRLGLLELSKGKYIYVGSAMNNLEKRVARHLARKKKKFWHIDYLLANKYAGVLKVYYKETGKIEECKVANKLERIGVPIYGFGCSDCNCKAHLFKIENLGNILKLYSVKFIR